jgi:threonine synthase
MKDSIPPKENVVVLLTGHGLKDIEFSSKKLKFPGALEPDIDLIIKKLGLKESLIIK